MTFYIPPVFLFGNKVRHIRNNQEKNKAEYKTATETGIQIENRNIKRIEELKEENETLRKENELLKECNIRNYTSRSDTDNMNLKLLEENKKLKEELEFYKKQYKHSMWEDYIDEDLYDLDC